MSKMKIEPVAIWAFDIDKMAKFYKKYFNATIGENISMGKKGLNLYFWFLMKVHELN